MATISTKGIQDVEGLRAFIGHLYRYSEEGFLEIRSFVQGRKTGFARQVYVPISDMDAINTAVSKEIAAERHVYFGVALRDGDGGSADHCLSIPCLWADVDFKTCQQDVADKLIMSCEAKPSAIVHSGNGYHVYWMLKEPLEAVDFASAHRVMKSIAVHLKGDNVADLPRILRCPGTENHKTFPAKPAKLVMLSKSEFTMDDLEEAFPDVEDVFAEKPSLEIRPVGSGERQNELVRWIGKWLSDGDDTEQTLIKAVGWNIVHCQPPLSTDEVKNTVRKCYNMHIRNHPEELIEIRGLPEPGNKGNNTNKGNNGNKLDDLETKETKGNNLETNLETNWKQTPPEKGLGGVAGLVRECIDWDGGNFTISDIYRDLNLTTRTEKTAARLAVMKLVKEGKLESLAQRGAYAVVSTHQECINLKDTKSITYDMVLPFGLGNLVRVMPKNLIVIAGESNAGKTALMLGMVAQNIAHYDQQYGRLSDSKRPRLSYFSSEMGPAEFRDRVDDFPHPLEFWDTMHAYERTENFHQVLDPNGLNFIDYLEVYDNFYEVGFKIRQIFDRLSGGVCVLALQKNQGTHYGLGGMHSVHKPRLYLSLASHAPYFSLMTITKAKSWASKTNPNGLSLAFKLSADAGFVSLGGWERREEKDIQALVKACKEQEGGEGSY